MSDLEVIKLDIPRSAKYVSVARKMVECIGLRLKFTTLQIDELTLAVGEACANAIKFGDPESKSVSLEYSIFDDRLVIEVRNAGPAFQWKKRAPIVVPLPDLAEGGMGLYLIERLMDEIAIRSECGITSVTMTKHLQAY